MRTILAGDIGGTHTRLAIFENDQPLNLKIYPSAIFSNLESIIQDYLADKNHLEIDVASFAVAGPIFQGICRVTNLPWIIDAKEIKNRFSFTEVFLLNDLEANAYALSVLPPESLCFLYRPKEEKNANRVVVSPGTGLGEAGIYWDGQNYHPFASEGGHADFAPVGQLQIELYQYLQNHYEHVPYEVALSGPGLSHIYQFLLDVKQRQEEDFLKEQKKTKDLSTLITIHAIDCSSKICLETLDIFCDILAQESANMALKLLAYGGIYLGGGIVPKILPKLKEKRFLTRFFQKGNFQAVLENMPLCVIIDEKAALKGSAFYSGLKFQPSGL